MMLVPAYGRDYASKKEVVLGFNDVHPARIWGPPGCVVQPSAKGKNNDDAT